MAVNWIVRHGAMRFLGEFDTEGRLYARSRGSRPHRAQFGTGSGLVRSDGANHSIAHRTDARPSHAASSRSKTKRSANASVRPRSTN